MRSGSAPVLHTTQRPSSSSSKRTRVTSSGASICWRRPWRVLACVTLLESTVLGSQWFEAERAAGVASETAQPVKNIPGSGEGCQATRQAPAGDIAGDGWSTPGELRRSEEHTSELQSCEKLVCRLLLEKKKRSLHAALQRPPLLGGTPENEAEQPVTDLQDQAEVCMYFVHPHTIAHAWPARRRPYTANT